MKAVSDSLFKTIIELQNIPALSKSSLGGGTSLAVRFGHRVSYDIDLFFPGIIGKSGYEKIRKQVETFYGNKVFAMDYPCNDDDQFIFQRFFISNNTDAIKVEILQNMQTYTEPEIIDGIRLLNINDIGLLKLITACNRANYKDIYDLDYITDHIPLNDLMSLLKIRYETYNLPEHESIFARDGEKSPIEEPELLLKFEEPVKRNPSRPSHSNPRIDLITGEKNWAIARSSWRQKVRAYYKNIEKDFPGIQPQ